MRIAVAVCALVSSLLLTNVGGKIPVQGQVSQERLLKQKPTVYIAFEREGKRPSNACPRDSGEGIWLRLHNNLSFPIAVCANYEIAKVKESRIKLRDGAEVNTVPDGTELELCYQVEAEWNLESSVTRDPKTGQTGLTMDIPVERTPPKQPLGCSCRYWDVSLDRRPTTWIRPGGSVVFSVPRKYLNQQYLEIYTSVMYEFELQNGNVDTSEPLHHVYFRADQLPARR